MSTTIVSVPKHLFTLFATNPPAINTEPEFEITFGRVSSAATFVEILHLLNIRRDISAAIAKLNGLHIGMLREMYENIKITGTIPTALGEALLERIHDSQIKKGEYDAIAAEIKTHFQSCQEKTETGSSQSTETKPSPIDLPVFTYTGHTEKTRIAIDKLNRGEDPKYDGSNFVFFTPFDEGEITINRPIPANIGDIVLKMYDMAPHYPAIKQKIIDNIEKPVLPTVNTPTPSVIPSSDNVTVKPVFVYTGINEKTRIAIDKLNRGEDPEYDGGKFDFFSPLEKGLLTINPPIPKNICDILLKMCSQVFYFRKEVQKIKDLIEESKRKSYGQTHPVFVYTGHNEKTRVAIDKLNRGEDPEYNGGNFEFFYPFRSGELTINPPIPKNVGEILLKMCSQVKFFDDEYKKIKDLIEESSAIITHTPIETSSDKVSTNDALPTAIVTPSDMPVLTYTGSDAKIIEGIAKLNQGKDPGYNAVGTKFEFFRPMMNGQIIINRTIPENTGKILLKMCSESYGFDDEYAKIKDMIEKPEPMDVKCDSPEQSEEKPALTYTDSCYDDNVRKAVEELNKGLQPLYDGTYPFFSDLLRGAIIINGVLPTNIGMNMIAMLDSKPFCSDEKVRALIFKAMNIVVMPDSPLKSSTTSNPEKANPEEVPPLVGVTSTGDIFEIDFTLETQTKQFYDVIRRIHNGDSIDWNAEFNDKTAKTNPIYSFFSNLAKYGTFIHSPMTERVGTQLLYGLNKFLEVCGMNACKYYIKLHRIIVGSTEFTSPIEKDLKIMSHRIMKLVYQDNITTLKEVWKNMMVYDHRFTILHDMYQGLLDDISSAMRDLLLEFIAAFGDDYKQDLALLKKYLLEKKASVAAAIAGLTIGTTTTEPTTTTEATAAVATSAEPKHATGLYYRSCSTPGHTSSIEYLQSGEFSDYRDVHILSSRRTPPYSVLLTVDKIAINHIYYFTGYGYLKFGSNIQLPGFPTVSLDDYNFVKLVIPSTQIDLSQYVKVNGSLICVVRMSDVSSNTYELVKLN